MAITEQWGLGALEGKKLCPELKSACLNLCIFLKHVESHVKTIKLPYTSMVRHI